MQREPDRFARILDYHERTKHTIERIYSRPHTLDWDNMPDSFRHYEGVPVLDLPADPPQLRLPALDVLSGRRETRLAATGAEFLSSLLFHSAAISATKVVPRTSYRYALRVNPSSGNLHPTEFHFATRGLRGWPDGLYHYRPSAHMAELRMQGAITRELTELASSPWLRDCPLIFVLTSIVWREAWKYRERAYRYCLLDIGHAWGALALAARALGSEAYGLGQFPDDEVTRLLAVRDEYPLLMVAIQGDGVPTECSEELPRRWFGGEPNRLSSTVTQYALIEQAHEASKSVSWTGVIPPSPPSSARSGLIPLGAPAGSQAPFGIVARRRRSALDFQGDRAIALAQLSSLLAAGSRPFQADFEGDCFGGASAQFVELYLYVHRVEGLAPGIYRYWPQGPALELVASGDQRRAAAALSLGQELAANAAVAFSMIADLERAFGAFNCRGYRYAHFEAGHIGQRFYLAAEAMGFQSTGIGAFFDDDVHRYLDIKPEQGQVIYHFACGHAVADPRLEP